MHDLFATQLKLANVVEITFVCGYGDVADVPESIISAVKLLHSHLYENREATTAMNLNEVPLAVDSLLSKHNWGGGYEEVTSLVL